MAHPLHGVVPLADGSLALTVHRQDLTGGSGLIDIWRDDARTTVKMESRFSDMAMVGVARGLVLALNFQDSEPGIWALPVDMEAGRLTGEPELLVPAVSQAFVSNAGTIAYVPLSKERGVAVRLDEEGNELQIRRRRGRRFSTYPGTARRRARDTGRSGAAWLTDT